MSHTYTATYAHCVFSTKERQNTIPDELRPKLWAYLNGIARNLKLVPIAIGGTANHVHLLASRSFRDYRLGGDAEAEG